MRRKQIRTFAGALSLSMLVGLGMTGTFDVNAATEHWNDASSATTTTKSWNAWKANWDTISSDYENVSLTPGVNEKQLNYAWYSKTAEMPKVRISTKKSMAGAKEIQGKQTAITLEGLTEYYSNKVTVTDLKENTKYYYQVFQDGTWQDVEKYTVRSFSEYSFLYVGDPQIGASSGQTAEDGSVMADNNLAARNDAYNWNETLKNALLDHPNVSFMVSAGDQVNTAGNEIQYAGYLGAESLASLPVATTIGNHDSKSVQYSLHYNNPNSFAGTDTTYGAGSTAAGSDYYYTYGDTLFVVLDTNNYNCATHENVIKKAINENKNVKWRVVMFHQDIYGSGYDHSDSDGMVLRTQLTPIMDKYDIDVVLQGHDHTYSRTYQITSDGKQYTPYNSSNYKKGDAQFLKDNAECYDIKSTVKQGTITNPEGTVYLEANSATGSKFYNLIATQQDYIAERSQTWTPSYSVINVTDTTFKMTTYDASTGEELGGSSSYTIVKSDTKEAAPQNITCQSAITKSVSDKSFRLNAVTSGNGALSYDSSNTDVAIVDAKGTVAVEGVGTTTITIKAAATKEYKEAVKTVTLTVTANNSANADTTPQTAVMKKAVSSRANTVTATWKKDTQAAGYQVVCSYKKDFSKAVKQITVKKNSKTSATFTKLSKGKKVYVKVRSYKIMNGTKVFGNYSKVKKITVK